MYITQKMYILYGSKKHSKGLFAFRPEFVILLLVINISICNIFWHEKRYHGTFSIVIFNLIELKRYTDKFEIS